MKHLSSIVNPSKGRGRLWRTLGLAAAAAVGCVFVSGGAFAAGSSHIKTDISVYYQVSTWYVQSDDINDASDQGFANLLRLNANFKDTNTGVSVHTSLNLLGDRWIGDEQGVYDRPNNFDNGNSGDAVYINYAYVQVPLGKTLLRAGRQKASWADCFLACKDNRDRIMLIHPFGSFTGVAGFDRRADGGPFENYNNSNMLFLVGLGKIPSTKFHYGLLFVHFFSSNGSGISPDDGGTPLSGFSLFSPFVSGDIGPVHLEGTFVVIHGGDVSLNDPGIYNIPGVVFTDTSWSYYLRAGWHITNNFLLRGQYVGTQDGGLMSPGFDTFSSMINDSPESKTNPTSVYDMGAAHGLKGFNEHLIIVNAVAQLTPKFSLSGSIGQLHIETPDNFGLAGWGDGASDNSMVYDVKGTYKVNKAVTFWATLGYLESNDAARGGFGGLAGNTLINGDHGTPVDSFDDDGVIAASLNMSVKF